MADAQQGSEAGCKGRLGAARAAAARGGAAPPCAPRAARMSANREPSGRSLSRSSSEGQTLPASGGWVGPATGCPAASSAQAASTRHALIMARWLGRRGRCLASTVCQLRNAFEQAGGWEALAKGVVMYRVRSNRAEWEQNRRSCRDAGLLLAAPPAQREEAAPGVQLPPAPQTVRALHLPSQCISCCWHQRC